MTSHSLRLFSRLTFAVLLSLTVGMGVFARPAAAALTYIVTSNSDEADAEVGDGECLTSTNTCTLRAAIQEANATVDAQGGGGIIAFNIAPPVAGFNRRKSSIRRTDWDADGWDGARQLGISDGVWRPRTSKNWAQLTALGDTSITLTSPLPVITSPLTINGYTQPGASANTLATGTNAVLLIEINGNSQNSALVVTTGGDGTVIRGLVVNRTGGEGIVVNANNCVVAGNYIGTAPDGTTRQANLRAGVLIAGGSNSTIGGTTPADRNVISGNANVGANQGNITIGSSSLLSVGNGIPIGTKVQGNYIGPNAAGTAPVFAQAFQSLPGVGLYGGTGTVIGGTTAGARNIVSGNASGFFFSSAFGSTVAIQGNYVGVGPDGQTALGNYGSGFDSDNGFTSDNATAIQSITIGGTVAGAGNVIASNQGDGIQVSALNLTIQGNKIGTNVNGTLNRQNSFTGIVVEIGGNANARPNVKVQIGGTTAAARNVVVGGTYGLRLDGITSGTMTVQGNYFGVLANGTTALGGTQDGILLTRPAIIGGTLAGAGNVVANFSGVGVNIPADTIPAPTGIPILGNSIYSNGRLGIDLGNNQVTANDAGDTDTGPNNLQNFPVFTNVTTEGTNVRVRGNFNSLANQPYRLEFFSSTAPDPLTYGEGQTYLGFQNVFTNAFGGASFETTVANVAGSFLSATATHLDTALAPIETSEFSGGFVTSSLTPVNATNPVGTSHTVTFTLNVNGAPQPRIAVNFSVVSGPNAGKTGSKTTDSQGQATFTYSDTVAGTDNIVASGTLSGISFSSLATKNWVAPASTLSIADASIVEGNTGTRNLTFTVTRAGDLSSASTVAYTTSDDSATQPDDYTATGGTLTFAANSATQTLTVPIVGDVIDENDETFNVTLSNPTNATLSDATAVGTIQDDDTATVSVSSPRVTEGNAGTTPVSVTVTLSTPSAYSQAYSYETQDGTAKAPGDYASSSGVVIIASGTTSQTIDLSVVGDTVVEPDETFVVNLAPAGAGLTAGTKFAKNLKPQALTNIIATGTVTIVNDDQTAVPTLSIADASTTEGNTGTKNLTFTVTRAGDLSSASTVAYTTSDGTVPTSNNAANAPDDYSAKSGTLTFAVGASTQTLTVPVVGDVLDEDNETFTVTLSNSTNATLADASAVGTIIDDDTATISVSSPRVTEGNAGTTPITVTFTLSAPSAKNLAYSYETQDSTAKAPGDYAAASGVLLFQSGMTSQTIGLSVVGDTIVEPDETFLVNVAATSGGLTNGGVERAAKAFTKNKTPQALTNILATGTITIVNDDQTTVAPTLSIADASIVEGNSGIKNLNFTVTRSGSLTNATTVSYATSNGTAIAPGDYTATNGTLTFAANSATQTIAVLIVGDTAIEPNETFNVTLSNPTNATLGDANAVGTILSDDGTDLALTQSATVNNDGSVSFNLSLINNGPINSTGVKIVNTLPTNATFVSSSDPSNPSPQNGTLTFNVGALAVGVTRTFSLRVAPTGAGTVTNTATVSSVESDTLPANNSATAQATIGNGPVVVTGQVQVKKASLAPIGKYLPGLFKSAKVYTQEIKLTNTGAALTGPVYLVFDGLKSGVKVDKSSGTTSSGQPYLQLSLGKDGLFTTNESIKVKVRFNLSSAKPSDYISYSVIVLAGATSTGTGRSK